MTTLGEWIHIADHAWERYGSGVHYTLHEDNGQWIVRRFSLSHGGDETKEAEESATTMDEAKRTVDRWESRS